MSASTAAAKGSQSIALPSSVTTSPETTRRDGRTNWPLTKTRPLETASSASRRRKCGMQRTSRNPEPEYVNKVSVFAAELASFFVLRAKKEASASTFRDVTAADDRGASAAAARAAAPPVSATTRPLCGAPREAPREEPREEPREAPREEPRPRPRPRAKSSASAFLSDDARAPLAAARLLALPAASGSELGGFLPRFGGFGTRASPLVRPRPIPAAASVHDGRSPPPAAATRKRVAGKRREGGRCHVCTAEGARKDEPKRSSRVEVARVDARATDPRLHRSDIEPSAVMSPVAATPPRLAVS
mmetsp:Transcript_12423/g.52016  ORF Transcript_12423/g.52016 Transcript_12423/m.52016 type:complete len:303 (+) Transcript_12423:1637-2545(+)